MIGNELLRPIGLAADEFAVPDYYDDPYCLK